MISRRALALGVPAMTLGLQRARAAGPTVKIGVLTDMSGVLSSVLGTGSVDGARMAIEDFGGSSAGMPVELVFADHQSKPDLASSIARKWLDEDGVDMIMDLGQSACAIAVQTVVKEHNKIIIVDGEDEAATLITGSFNFTHSAQAYNAENLLLLRGNPALVKAYRDNWQQHRMEAVPYAEVVKRK